MLDYYLFKQVKDLFLAGSTTEAGAMLAELQEKYVRVCDENSQLRDQIQEFEDILYLAKNLEYDGFSYWLRTGSIRQGPFCSKCFDRDGLLVRLGDDSYVWRCFSCGHEVDQSSMDDHDLLPGRDHDRVVIGKPARNGHSGQGKVIHLYK